MMREAVVTILTDDDAVANLVVDHVSPNILTQNDLLPAITFHVDGPHVESFVGLTGDCNARIHLACWSKSYSKAQSIAVAVRNALIGTKGIYNGTILYACLGDDSRDEYVPPEDGTGNGLEPVMVDLRAWYKET